MKNLKKVTGLKTLTRNDQKKINGGLSNGALGPGLPPGSECPWNMCLNIYGRCSVLECPDGLDEL